MPDINAGIIGLLNGSIATRELLEQCDLGNNKVVVFNSLNELARDHEKLHLNIEAIISESEIMEPTGVGLIDQLKKKKLDHIPFFLLPGKLDGSLTDICLQAGVAEVFARPLNKERLESRINFIVKHWTQLQQQTGQKVVTLYKTPFLKRSFDIVFAGCALLALSPVLLIVMACMKLESKGAVFYYSLRVGTGYRIFKFYKFRSMYVNADKRLKELQHLNQYNNEKAAEELPGMELCDECKAVGKKCRNQLHADENIWCEKQYLTSKKQQSGAAFFKLKNDPRITKVGAFIRNTSIDELPQLWNVLKGDMSIVGNRPLPLYEAEKLTTDKYALRFLAPAGITGLWQVEKRGKGEMSEEERLMLDNVYAEKHSFWYDIKLILKTIPALFQKENV